MKRFILLLGVITVVLTGCKKEDPVPLDTFTEKTFSFERYTEEQINNHKLKVTDKKGLFIQGVANSASYKFAHGRKNGNAWIARFRPDGTELFAYTAISTRPDRKYSWFQLDERIAPIEDDLMFVWGRFSKDSTPSRASNPRDFTSFLSVLDTKNGKEIKRWELETSAYKFKVSSSANNYLIDIVIDDNVRISPKDLSPQLALMDKSGSIIWEKPIEGYTGHRLIDFSTGHLIEISAAKGMLIRTDKQGKIVWERAKTEHETDFSTTYQRFIPLSGDRMAFTPNLYYIDQYNEDDYCKVVDLKGPSLLAGFNKKNAPLLNDNDSGLIAVIQSLTVEGDVIQLNYKKIDQRNEKDPVTGQSKTKYVDVEKWYYRFSAKDYSVIEHKKVQL